MTHTLFIHTHTHLHDCWISAHIIKLIICLHRSGLQDKTTETRSQRQERSGRVSSGCFDKCETGGGRGPPRGKGSCGWAKRNNSERWTEKTPGTPCCENKFTHSEVVRLTGRVTIRETPAGRRGQSLREGSTPLLAIAVQTMTVQTFVETNAGCWMMSHRLVSALWITGSKLSLVLMLLKAL